MRRFFKHQIFSGVLLAGDIVFLPLLFKLAHYWHVHRHLDIWSWTVWFIASLTVVALYIASAYTPDWTNRGIRILARTWAAVISAGLIAAAIAYVTRANEADPLFWRGTLVNGFTLFLVYASVARLFVSWWQDHTQKSPRWMVLGNSERVEQFRDQFKRSLMPGVLIEVDVDSDSLVSKFNHEFGSNGNFSGIIIANTENRLPEEVERGLMYRRLSGMRVYGIVDFFERHVWKIPVEFLDEAWILLAQGFDLVHHKAQLKIKRALDLVLSVLLLVLLSPVLLITALLIRTDTRGPVLYRQVRTGKNGREFVLFKFRTMVEDAESSGPQWAMESDPRVTRIGRVLRRFRLDELPQLWNVLKGEMSFIGPRPERPDFVRELEQTIRYYDLRSLVAPGITGWAQVMYPYGASTDDAREKLQYDLYYIKNYSLVLDFIIAMKTLRVIFFAKGR